MGEHVSHRRRVSASGGYRSRGMEAEMSMRQQVEETIEVIRPALQADGGDIILREVDESNGVVSVTLTGACTTCPASDQTLKAGIERIMKDRIDGVTEVVQVA
jgi:Fe-S cluster biogenesis protein NfuA